MNPPSYTSSLFDNIYVLTVIKLVLILYSAQIVGNIPVYMQKMFNNTIFKIVYVFLLTLTVRFDIQFALVFAIVFVVGSNYASGKPLFEMFSDTGYSAFAKTFTKDTTSTLLIPQNNIYSGCAGIKLQTLINAFGGDKLKLQTTVQSAFKDLLSRPNNADAQKRLLDISYIAGLPHNVHIDDENAPLIATVLVDYGFNFGGNCHMV